MLSSTNRIPCTQDNKMVVIEINIKLYLSLMRKYGSISELGGDL
jgi:hypothetical protein